MEPRYECRQYDRERHNYSVHCFNSEQFSRLSSANSYDVILDHYQGIAILNRFGLRDADAYAEYVTQNGTFNGSIFAEMHFFDRETDQLL